MKKSLKNIICLIILISIVFLVVNIYTQKNIKDISQAETSGKYAENEIEDVLDEDVDSVTEIDLKYNPNGGEYVALYSNNTLIPARTATIETEVTMEGLDANIREVQYAWNQNAQTQPTSWTSFSKMGERISKTDATEGSWYLWIKMLYATGSEDFTIHTSNAFVVKKDEIAPTIETIEGSTEKGNTGKITVSGIKDEGGSELKAYFVSKNSTTPSSTEKGWIANTESNIEITVEENGVYYVWVMDNEKNISEMKSCEVSGIVPRVEQVELTLTSENNILKKGNTALISKKLIGGEEYKSIKYTSGNEDILSIDNEKTTVTGIGTGTTTITCTITNYDGTSIEGNCELTVVDLKYNPNGGKYTVPKTATIETEIIMEGIDSNIENVQYAWNQDGETRPTNWEDFSKMGGTISKTDATKGNWYLWVKILHITGSDKYVVYKSDVFTVEEEPIYITSTEYEIGEGYITGIQPNTKISDFKAKIETNADLKIYDNEDNELNDNDIVKTGIKITAIEEGISYKIVVKGDVNGDGKADMEDIFSINKHRLNKLNLKDEFLLAGDVNNDEKVDISDILQINKYRLEKIQIL